MARIEPISVDAFFETALPLMVAHREELTTNKELMQLNPRVDVYDQLEGTGALLALAAYDDDGEIVGYSVNIVSPNLHYADVLQCQNDLLFTAEHARSKVGLALVRATEAEAKARGCRLMLWHAKPASAMSRLMQAECDRGRSRVQDVVYSKDLI